MKILVGAKFGSKMVKNVSKLASRKSALLTLIYNLLLKLGGGNDTWSMAVTSMCLPYVGATSDPKWVKTSAGDSKVYISGYKSSLIYRTCTSAINLVLVTLRIWLFSF